MTLSLFVLIAIPHASASLSGFHFTLITTACCLSVKQLVVGSRKMISEHIHMHIFVQRPLHSCDQCPGGQQVSQSITLISCTSQTPALPDRSSCQNTPNVAKQSLQHSLKGLHTNLQLTPIFQSLTTEPFKFKYSTYCTKFVLWIASGPVQHADENKLLYNVHKSYNARSTMNVNMVIEWALSSSSSHCLLHLC